MWLRASSRPACEGQQRGIAGPRSSPAIRHAQVHAQIRPFLGNLEGILLPGSGLARPESLVSRSQLQRRRRPRRGPRRWHDDHRRGPLALEQTDGGSSFVPPFCAVDIRHGSSAPEAPRAHPGSTHPRHQCPCRVGKQRPLSRKPGIRISTGKTLRINTVLSKNETHPTCHPLHSRLICGACRGTSQEGRDDG